MCKLSDLGGNQMKTRIYIDLINRNKSFAVTAANWRQQMSTSKRWNLHFGLSDLIIILYIVNGIKIKSSK